MTGVAVDGLAFRPESVRVPRARSILRRLYVDSSTRWSCQSFIEHNSSQDQTEDDRGGQQQPAPILGWMAQNTDKMASIVICDDRDEGVTRTSANDHDCQKSPDTVVRRTGRRKEHAGGHRNWYRRGDSKSACAPCLKKVENGIQFPIRELAVQVSRSSFSCDPEREVCSDD